MLTSIRESRTCFYGARKNYFMYDILSYCTAQIVGTGHILGLWKRSEIAFSFFVDFLLLFYVYRYFTCMYISTPYACLEPAEAQREHIGSPGTRDRASCEFPCSC